MSLAQLGRTQLAIERIQATGREAWTIDTNTQNAIDTAA